ncbi:Serine/threonine-protein kinase polo [Gryllus bimaculatus]|nr:Serine/threonine-protein kinase polo [Gryllus bimaculatus]
MARKAGDTSGIPAIIYDPHTETRYKIGRFFGKGGFAKCYEIIDIKSNQIFAGKIVPKKNLVGSNQKEKMTQEINIHRSLKHPNIVGFYNFFDDDNFVYIVLELCRNRSMMEMQKRRKCLTEPEVRYFLHQILIGVDYLHKRNIIHRDLKLGNLFLNDNMEVRIGDFGLAAKVEYQGERKKTLCGTPNYIAPEILTKKGHSFEVDVWSIGCIMYTLLFGKPPFETSSLKETYALIKKCQYCIPQNKVSKKAKDLIVSMLQTDPKIRPTIEDLLRSDYFMSYMPKQLPVSCLTMAPRQERAVMRKPLLEVNTNEDGSGGVVAGAKKPDPAGNPPASAQVMVEEVYANLKKLEHLIVKVLSSKPAARGAQNEAVYGDEMTDPAAQPIVWISKWVDYSDKYGFGYMLCDESVGVVFNDNTKIVMLSDGINVHYITKEGFESYHTMENFPPTLDKKMKLLTYFRRYMNEHLSKAGASVAPRESDTLSRIPCMVQWCRRSSAVIMHLNNGTLQVNFSDHTKVVLCPHMAAITFINADKSFRTYRFSTITEQGCIPQLENAMKFVIANMSSIEARVRV